MHVTHLKENISFQCLTEMSQNKQKKKVKQKTGYIKEQFP